MPPPFVPLKCTKQITHPCQVCGCLARTPCRDEESARHAIAAGHAIRTQGGLPQLVAAAAEYRGGDGEVIAPHAAEALVIARRQGWPCRLDVGAPGGQGAVV